MVRSAREKLMVEVEPANFHAHNFVTVFRCMLTEDNPTVGNPNSGNRDKSSFQAPDSRT